jgi:hypothetical protein
MAITSVSGIESPSSASTPGLSQDAGLASLLAKVSAGGDLASECTLLFAEDNACQMKARYQGVRVHEREVRQARRRRMELLRQYYQAKKESGFWSFLGSVFKKLFAAASAALVVFGGPVGVVGVAGALATGGCKIAGSYYDKQAARATAGKLEAEHMKQTAEGLRDDELCSLEEAVQVERRMVARLHDLLHAEQHGVTA